MNTWAYHLVLVGQYDAAYETAERMRAEAEAYGLEWARPHAEWALAAAAFGRRQFGVAENWLRRVEQAADQLRDGQLTLNASCLRARLLLALQQPRDALSALSVDETLAANRAMRGEFVATRALVLAVLKSTRESVAAARRATELTTWVEARAYAACSQAILQDGTSGEPEIAQHLETVDELGTWDVLVSAFRASPALLKTFAKNGLPATVATALRNANDYDLARHAGIDIGRRPRRVSTDPELSPREVEVIELVGQGLTDHDIAQALFISEATVRTHMRHVREKTGARSRAEAIATLQTRGN